MANPEDRAKHFTIYDLALLPAEQFADKISKRTAALGAGSKQALIFVHGYWITFDSALYRAAQIAYDLQFDGVSFLFSWPSLGQADGYLHDEENARLAGEHFLRFLQLVRLKSNAEKIHLIAHSMGTLPVMSALETLGKESHNSPPLGELVFAAPDMDRELFRRYVGKVRSLGRGITLYASTNDPAMAAARRIRKGLSRAGDAADRTGPLLVEGVDTIDVTNVGTDVFTNHAVFAEKREILIDIALLLQTGTRPPDKRLPILRSVDTGNGRYWRLP